jgi:hypothetical protein
MNMFTSQNPQSVFLNNILCTNVVFNENLEAISRTILWNLALKRRENGSANIIKRFKTEEERIIAIEGEFGVKLTPIGWGALAYMGFIIVILCFVKPEIFFIKDSPVHLIQKLTL